MVTIEVRLTCDEVSCLGCAFVDARKAWCNCFLGHLSEREDADGVVGHRRLQACLDAQAKHEAGKARLP